MRVWVTETETSLNYNCDKVESKEGGLRRDENKDLLDRDGEREGDFSDS